MEEGVEVSVEQCELEEYVLGFQDVDEHGAELDVECLLKRLALVGSTRLTLLLLMFGQHGSISFSILFINYIWASAPQTIIMNCHEAFEKE